MPRGRRRDSLNGGARVWAISSIAHIVRVYCLSYCRSHIMDRIRLGVYIVCDEFITCIVIWYITMCLLVLFFY